MPGEQSAAEARRLGKELETAAERLKAVLAENASLASRLEESGAESERLRAASLDLRDQLDATRAELETARSKLEDVAGSASRLGEERDKLAESLDYAEKQLAAKSTARVLPAKEVSRLVDGFVADLDSALSGMSVREGEIQLKVGFQGVGRTKGFVVPGPETPPEARENLHEIRVRFGRTADPPNAD